MTENNSTLSAEERERLAEFADSDRKYADMLSKDRRGRVSAEKCVEMRQAYKNSDRRADAAESFPEVSNETVRYHAFGRCEHDVDENPAKPVR